MSVLIPIADGSESLETVTLVNVLRRGDIPVTLLSIEAQTQVKTSRDLTITADIQWQNLPDQAWQAIVLPGGVAGAERLAAHRGLAELLRKQRIQQRWLGAICAAPALVLSPLGLLDGKQATCYPAFREKLLHYVDQPVVVDGHCITSQGPATALAFALRLVSLLKDAATAKRVADAMLLP